MRGWNLAMRFRDMPMERKMILIFLFLIMLPISSLSYFSFDRYSESIEDNTTAYVTELADRMIGSLDDYVADMKRLTAVPGAVEEIRDSLRLSNEYYERPHQPPSEGAYLIPQTDGAVLEIQRRVEQSIFFLNSVKEGANSIYLFDKYGNGYFRIQVGGVRSDIHTTYKSWQRVATEARGNAVMVSTQEFTDDFNSKRYVFTVVRNIFSPSLELLGMIAVDANISVIEKYVKNLDKVTGGTTLILDETNHVIYDSGKTFLAQDKSDDPLVRMAEERQGSFYFDRDGHRSIVIHSQSDYTGWKVFITVPVEKLTKDAAKSRDFTVAAALVITVFALVISIFLSFALTKPLRSLMQLMKHVQGGNLDVKFPVKRRDEVGMLGFHFNRMIGRIRDLINDNYSMQLRRKEAELLALQSQINPHFLYNTLESIRMTAEVGDNGDVADMIHLLGKLLRYSVSMKNEIVRLEEEMAHLETFMRIVDYRYPHRFRMQIQDYEAIRSAPIVKLLLQPVVENAVLHGFDERKESMTIELSHRITSDTIVFCVRDDGVGMDDAKLTQLRASLDMPPADAAGQDGGIGLRNVNERIRLYYGEAYGLEVASAPGAGTSVYLTVPRGTSYERRDTGCCESQSPTMRSGFGSDWPS